MLKGVILGAVPVIRDPYFLMNINLMTETIEHISEHIYRSHDCYFLYSKTLLTAEIFLTCI